MPNPPAECQRDPVSTCWLNGMPITWNTPCASFSLNGRAAPKLDLGYDEALGILNEAFATWQGAACPTGPPSIGTFFTEPASCERLEFNPEGPNANVVAFRESAWQHDPLLVALTQVTFNASNGEILDVDMEVNVVDYAPSRQFLKYVLTHEAGHYFGLDHTNDTSALMSPVYASRYDEPALLAADDVAAICASYPASAQHARALESCDPLPRTGFSPDCGGDVDGGCTLLEKSARPVRPSGAFAGLVLALLFLRKRARTLITRDMR